MPFVCGQSGSDHPKASYPKSQGSGSLPPDGWHVAKITAVEEKHRAASGKLFHRLTFTVQCADYKSVTCPISCDESGTPVGRFGWPRLNEVAKAVGLVEGQAYELRELMHTPVRVLFKRAERFVNVEKVEKCTSQDRADLAEYEAQLGIAEESQGGM